MHRIVLKPLEIQYLSGIELLIPDPKVKSGLPKGSVMRNIIGSVGYLRYQLVMSLC